jgi:hypothetical protein
VPDASRQARGLSGNPIIGGWYADPEAIVYGDRYWLFPTFSDDYPAPRPIDESTLTPRQTLAINRRYLRQTFIDAFSSPDLVHWTKHARVLDITNVPWAAFAVWAPSTIRANGKYYLFFAANDIQNDKEEGGIGVAVADRPEGPYVDAIGAPLINAFHHGAQPIDPFVFRDDDGQHYLYYGGWKHCNVVKLSPDLRSVVPFADGETFKTSRPNFVEGPSCSSAARVYLVVGGRWGARTTASRAIADARQVPSRAWGCCNGSCRRDRRRSPLVIPVPGSDTWFTTAARSGRRQPPRGLHRRDALQRRRHHPARDHHV